MPAWLGLKSASSSVSRPELYWTDNTGTPVQQLSFGVDSNQVQGAFNIGPLSSSNCVSFYFYSENKSKGNGKGKSTLLNISAEWDTDDCNNSTYNTPLCELVCDNSTSRNK